LAKKKTKKKKKKKKKSAGKRKEAHQISFQGLSQISHFLQNHAQQISILRIFRIGCNSRFVIFECLLDKASESKNDKNHSL
jgi:hypothetical protein